ncbi:MAG: branched-chain amino acid ABC transporter permease [Chloroflexi bacterium GWB2_49_20]|nr:MAG: branched-chain amino acid ABC transporter permease [Chloroflexi bacterium GWB2_49_20]OGN79046.1 MAG: branched-chain amino acid ABC transporter permease [Chloroflexi bacterium GWC2_49_37]OGN86559.1 MAG: branched-chain amino acid ABC transporter permease [Chloroflexi bacterium GWD2_49_16]HBG74607.1 branched-chain amino acid ABC transporter permease [Anaerolineae bacterium]
MNRVESSSFSEFLFGFRDELPILVGVIPFGLIFAILAQQANISAVEAQAMSLIVFAGSSQFMLVQLAGINAPIPVMVVTGFIINLRHLLYSASIAPYTRKLSYPWKLILSYLLTDEAYAVTIAYFQKNNKSNMHWYYLGAGLALWGSWQLSTWFGLLLGAQIPSNWSLDFSLALTFIALVVPMIKDRPSLFVALSAGFVAIITANFPYKLGLLIAALAGILVGLWSEKN